MNNPPRIALFGKRRSGKDTLGEVLQTVVSEVSSRARQRLSMVPIHRFDAPLAFLPVTDDRLADLKTYMTARDDGYFVRLFKTRTDLTDGSIITDGQRAIEYAWCKTHGYLMVYLMCGDEERMRRGVHQDDLKAPAEIALDVLGIDAWDVVLQTDLQTIDECASDILDALEPTAPVGGDTGWAETRWTALAVEPETDEQEVRVITVTLRRTERDAAGVRR